ncbi:MAG: HRDC domain-containing protein [Rikenellaceae bacterium]
MTELRSNYRIDLAREFILSTRANIFLTGKAGTGKTTFLRGVVGGLGKRAVIAAPTGVAALNAGGVTLHSLFQLPFGVNIPGVQQHSKFHRISKSKLSLIRSIELLIIDEISMVRCDVLDAIDQTLRRVRRSMQPFAGVQLLLIGDIQQLAPICRDEEWEQLREHYATPYFFDSQALKRSTYVTIEFDEIFRQSDSHFTNILNAIRENQATPQILEELNRRYIPGFDPADSEDYITLSTHNHTANSINTRKLAAISSPNKQFTAKVSGDFAESAYPNDNTLELKKGAQVLFIKNDVSPQKRYYNGLLGVITAMDDKSVTVQPKSGGAPITVEAVAWESIDYAINAESGEMEQVVKGTFSQIPLKCAWAITIHKSQGLSFDRAVIDASGSFAHGQLYVALSRCRTLEGLVLRTPISTSAIIGDSSVESFSSYVSKNQPTPEMLEAFKRDYYCKVLCEIFEFEQLQRLLWELMSEITGPISKTYPKLTSTLMDLLGTFENSVVKVGVTFQSQLKNRIYSDENYAESSFIEERLKKSAEYFTPRLEALRTILTQLEAINPDSAESRRRIADFSNRLKSQVSLVFNALELCSSGFSLPKYQLSRANIIALESISSESKPSRKVSQTVKREAPSDITHDELYQTLAAWRLEESRELKVRAYQILNNRTLMHIQGELPTTIKELSLISGMGTVKMEKYADQIIEIVKEYCFSNNIDPKKGK